MKVQMATRKPDNLKVDRSECTDFVLHKSQQTKFDGLHDKIIDYTEKRLLRYAKVIDDPTKKLNIMALLKDYIDGNVAIAWRKGEPVFIRVIKNA